LAAQGRLGSGHHQEVTMATKSASDKKPNILIIWGDDIGWFNISANNIGIMGYRTPNIDRVAKEGCLFTDWYGNTSPTDV
jgi:arylsulfatase A-like enzyme